MIPERYKDFLLERAKANRIRHSGRDLYAHLCGTYELLQDWGTREPVCDAGLFHSIYGTRRFRKTAWPLDERPAIRKLIGREAEFLAYLFCVTDRPKALLSVNPHLPRLRDCHTGDMLMLSTAIVNDLLTIEAANLLEQGSSDRWLRQLARTNIGEAAKQDIGKYLAARGEQGGATVRQIPA